MNIPTLREFFHANLKSNDSLLDYGAHLEDLNRHSRFMDHWGLMLFILDIPTGTYPFLNKGTTYTMGVPEEAMKEGGIDFTLSRLEIPDDVQKEFFKEQFRILSEHPDMPGQQFQIKVANPIRDNNGHLRCVLQQSRLAFRDTSGIPLGYFGSAMWVDKQAANIKIFQEIEIYHPEENQWVSVSYKEFSPWIDPDKLLSSREIEILKLITDGRSSKQIADKLCLSLHTVHTHRKNMLRRTNSVNTAELIKYALSYNLI